MFCFCLFLIEMKDKGENLDFGRKIVCMYYVEMELPQKGAGINAIRVWRNGDIWIVMQIRQSSALREELKPWEPK